MTAHQDRSHSKMQDDPFDSDVAPYVKQSQRTTVSPPLENNKHASSKTSGSAASRNHKQRKNGDSTSGPFIYGYDRPSERAKSPLEQLHESIVRPNTTRLSMVGTGRHGSLGPPSHAAHNSRYMPPSSVLNSTSPPPPPSLSPSKYGQANRLHPTSIHHHHYIQRDMSASFLDSSGSVENTTAEYLEMEKNFRLSRAADDASNSQKTATQSRLSRQDIAKTRARLKKNPILGASVQDRAYVYDEKQVSDEDRDVDLDESGIARRGLPARSTRGVNQGTQGITGLRLRAARNHGPDYHEEQDEQDSSDFLSDNERVHAQQTRYSADPQSGMTVKVETDDDVQILDPTSAQTQAPFNRAHSAKSRMTRHDSGSHTTGQGVSFLMCCFHPWQ